MDINRVAIVYESKERPETTGSYCEHALKEFVHVESFLPDEISQIPHGYFDLYLNIDDGFRYHWPKNLRPSAWWAIDTHMDFSWHLEKSPEFDLVFTAQRDGTFY